MPTETTGQPGFKALEYWLNHLPFTDHYKAADIIFKVLHSLRQENLPQARWFALLERFDSAIDAVVVASRMEIYNLPLPLDDKHQRSDQVNKLQIELAECYAEILEQFLTGTKIPLPLLANAAYRALYHLSEVQKWSYQLYSPVPAGLWERVYQVYQISQNLQLTSYPFTAPNTTENCVTLQDMYKQLLLLSAANTSRMQSNEISVVSQCITSWVAHAELDKWQGEKDVYLFDLSTDKGPLWFGEHKVNLPSSQIHSLDLTDVNLELMKLSHILARIPEGELDMDGKVVTRSLVQRLLQAWHNKPMRQFKRDSQRGEIKLYADIESRQQQELCIDDWDIINVSATGYCLAKRDAVPSGLHVGQWFKVQSKNQNLDWQMAVIRWLHHDISQGVQIGIQIFDNQPVSIDVLADGEQRTANAWLLPSSPDQLSADTLLVANDYELGDIINVKTDQGEQAMRLGQKIEHSSSHSQFQLHPAKH